MTENADRVLEECLEDNLALEAALVSAVQSADAYRQLALAVLDRLAALTRRERQHRTRLKAILRHLRTLRSLPAERAA